MTTVFSGSNSSELYLQALHALLKDGKRANPRGKQTAELRPVVIEYLDPTDRVTTLKGRIINPFFQLAEALWILGGRADVAWLSFYNSNMANFSDDGIHFNAPYGERIRFWGKNRARGIVSTPSTDQLKSAYLRLKEDPDTRQAVITIANPTFDSYQYTNLDKGKDIACNLNIKCKIRDGKLDISVDNRSNDLHWGTFGANLCQFATIQEVLASWLGVGIGTYYQISDSLHIYLDDYGAKETDKILKHHTTDTAQNFRFDDEPRMSLDFLGYDKLMWEYWTTLDELMHSDDTYTDRGVVSLLESIEVLPDEYWKMTFQAMVAYNAHKRGLGTGVYHALSDMKDCQWKVSCLRFLYPKYTNDKAFQSLYISDYNNEVIAYIERKNG